MRVRDKFRMPSNSKVFFVSLKVTSVQNVTNWLTNQIQRMVLLGGGAGCFRSGSIFLFRRELFGTDQSYFISMDVNPIW